VFVIIEAWVEVKAKFFNGRHRWYFFVLQYYTEWWQFLQEFWYSKGQNFGIRINLREFWQHHWHILERFKAEKDVINSAGGKDKYSFKPLKETNVGMAQAFFDL